MATASHARTLLGSLEPELKKALGEVSDYVFNNNFAFGPIDANEARTKTTNMAGRYVKVLTNASAGQEFSVVHGLGRTPNVCWPVMHPRVTNSVFLGDLVISQPADEKRIYFTSQMLSATGFIYVE